jgi:hypothetical protein
MSARTETIETLERWLSRLLANAHRYERASEGAPIKRVYMFRRLAKRARKLIVEIERRIDIMRRNNLVGDGAPKAPVPGQKLVAWRSLTIGSKQYRRGQEIDAAEFSQCLNADALLRGGHVVWAFPVAEKKPAPKPTPPALSTPDIRDNPMLMCALAMAKLVDAGRCDWIGAEDIVDHAVYTRAQRAYIEQPQELMDGGWGTDGGSKIRSGVGSYRRVFNVDGFRKRLRELAAEHAREAAA